MGTKANPHIIDTLDYLKNRVIFTHDKWQEKSLIHPELRKASVIRNLKQAIEKPEIVIQDKDDPKNKKCYYKKYSINTYLKAIVLTKYNPCCIISAFSTDYIKEYKYPNLKQLL
jgi:hypothetical protein